MLRPIPYSLIVPDQKAYVAEAHRMRSTAVADLIRHFVRWLSAASR
jgi:hypothetical protein